jgi:hypothetical protein
MSISVTVFLDGWQKKVTIVTARKEEADFYRTIVTNMAKINTILTLGQ